MQNFQGSGKTLAFGIPIVAGLLELQEQRESGDVKKVIAGGPKALILTPTRELAVQIREHLRRILTYTPFRVCAAIF
jgi:ATP-dependent RNA helicase DDX24/MAK5